MKNILIVYWYNLTYKKYVIENINFYDSSILLIDLKPSDLKNLLSDEKI